MNIFVKIILTISILILGNLGPTIIKTSYGMSFGLFSVASVFILYGCFVIWKCPKSKPIKGYKDKAWGGNSNDLYGLKAELLKHINPQNYVKPFDSSKLAAAKCLSEKLCKIKNTDLSALKEIRNEAATKLGVNLNVEAFYNHLLVVFSPVKFTKNSNMFEITNQLCQELTANNHDIDMMENILNEKVTPILDSNIERVSSAKWKLLVDLLLLVFLNVVIILSKIGI